MKQSNINIGIPQGTYEPKEIEPWIKDEETDVRWLFYKDLINLLFDAKLITDSQRFHMLVNTRKKLGLRVV